MEQIEGGLSKAQWCVIGGGLGAVVGMATGGHLGRIRYNVSSCLDIIMLS